MKKGDTELQQQINDGLAAIRTNGTYAKIYQNYWTTRPEN
nr:transporter substrate-binding domain-containing protein [Simonsiella muelleri]